MQGLTDGMSSRYLRGNRSLLLPALENLRSTHNDKRARALHGRLEELLVFEILKQGGTSYHCFSVRTLHKYILDAITQSGEPKTDPQEMLNDLPLGRALLNKSPLPVDTSTQGTNRLAVPEAPRLRSHSKEEVVGDDDVTVNRSRGARDVTYRELLGGFLHPRDLRKLVTPFSASNEPEFVVRRHVMLLHFDSMRAVILRDRVLLLVPDGADSLLRELEEMILGGNDAETEAQPTTESMKTDEDDVSVEPLNSQPPPKQQNLVPNKSQESLADDSAIDNDVVVELEDEDVFKSMRQDEWAELEGNTWVELPFELQSVDAVLNRVCSILAEDVLDLQMSADSLISELLVPGADLGERAQETLRMLKNLVRELLSRVTGFRRSIENMLEDYEELALMNLSRLLTHPDRFIQPVPQAVLDEESDEPELILEAHLQRAYTLANALSLVQGQIDSTEEFVVQKSDSIRNRLLYINMLISLLSLAVAGASLVGSLFGMNVPNPVEDSERAFYFLSAMTAGGAGVFVIIVFVIIRMAGVLPRFS